MSVSSSKHVSQAKKQQLRCDGKNNKLQFKNGIYSKGILGFFTIFLMLKREPFAYLFKDDDGLTCCLRYRDTNFSPLRMHS